ncbi:hypothetical protein [Caulobacter sp. FWC2]|uniref:hypothetical protein n=1 Tax=Caulobacter sp. FWC2 TaxID=69664 RepID=UPI001177F160|nr:hypothetical protein [Caulobacter sp. FWC2]
MPTYLICGLRVEADRPLPGAIPLADGRPDAVLREGVVSEHLDGAVQQRPFWALSDEAFLWRGHGLGRFLVRQGREILIEAEPGGSLEEVVPFVMGTGIAALLYQRGAMLLHASAVTFEGRAYAFCGPSGAGKSTLAAALCQAGAGFLSDDITQVAVDPQGKVVLHADGRDLKLTPRSIAQLGLDVQARTRVRSRIKKYFVGPPVAAPLAVAPLAGVYFLMFDRTCLAPAITPLPALTTAQMLLEEAFRPKLALAMLGRGRMPHMTPAILSQAGGFSLRRPEALESIDQSVAQLLEHWRQARV